MTSVLVQEKQRDAGDGQKRGGDATMETGTGVTWPQVKECWRPPEAGRGKRSNSPTGPQMSTALLDFELLASRTVRKQSSVVLSHPVCANVLQQPQEPNRHIRGHCPRELSTISSLSFLKKDLWTPGAQGWLSTPKIMYKIV